MKLDTKTIDTKVVHRAESYFTCHEDQVEVKGERTKYHTVDFHDGVMVVPIKVSGTDFRFVMVSQYRYPIAGLSLEWPGGARGPGEAGVDAARRELKEETGYDVATIELLNVTFPAPFLSGNKTNIYLAILAGSQAEQKLDPTEASWDLRTVELSSKELWNKVRNGEITDARTLAALSIVLLQSPKALEFLQVPESKQESTSKEST